MKKPSVAEAMEGGSGACRSRTGDLLTAREITSVAYLMKIKYIKKRRITKISKLLQKDTGKGHSEDFMLWFV